MAIERGFNSDVAYHGGSFHVQTEDWGLQNPFLVSRVYCNGAVVKSIKTSYVDVLPKGLKSDSSSIRLALKMQHQKILDLLLSGQLL